MCFDPYNHTVFIRDADGPNGERRYKDVYRGGRHESRDVERALERAGVREVITQQDRRPPGTR